MSKTKKSKLYILLSSSYLMEPQSDLYEQRDRARESSNASVYFQLCNELGETPTDKDLYILGQNENEFLDEELERKKRSKLVEMSKEERIEFQFGSRSFGDLSIADQRILVGMKYSEGFVRGKSNSEIYNIAQDVYRRAINKSKA